MKLFIPARWIAMTFSLGLACVGAAPDDDAPSSLGSAIACSPTPPPLFDASCTLAQQAKILSAWSQYIAPQACGSALRACLQEARFSPADEAFAEEIHRRLTAASPTRIFCGPPTPPLLATPEPVADGEGVRVSGVSSGSTADIAAEILGALAENAGYLRLGTSPSVEYAVAVRSQVSACSRQLSSGASPALPGDRQRRSGAERETELQPFGNPGPAAGTPTFVECPVGGTALTSYLTTALSVAVGASGVIGLRQTCTNDAGQSVLGPLVGSGPFSAPVSCPVGHVVAGVRAIANAQGVLRLTPLCRSWLSPTAAPTPASTLPQLSSITAPNPLLLDRVCPPGMYLSALGGRAGATLDHLRVWCREQRTFPTPQAWSELAAMSFTAPIGVLRVHDERCTERGGITGLYGQATAIGTIRRLGAMCRGYRTSTGYDAALAHTLAAAGATNTAGLSAFSGGCPAGEVATGLVALTEGSSLRALKFTCGRVVGGVVTTEHYQEVTGDWSNTAGQVFRHCAAGRQLAGLRVSYTEGFAPGIHRIVPICRQIPTN